MKDKINSDISFLERLEIQLENHNFGHFYKMDNVKLSIIKEIRTLEYRKESFPISKGE